MNQGGMKKFGKVVGFVVMYFVFTTVLYFLLRFLGKFPEGWNYFYLMLVTLAVVLFGNLLKILLKT